MLKIDLHAHYFPLKIMKDMKDDLKFSVERIDKSNQISIRIGNIVWNGEAYLGLLEEDKIIEETVRGEVDIRVLSLAPISYIYDLDEKTAMKFYTRFNDELSKLSEKSNGKLLGFAGVPLQYPSLAVDELKRAVKDLGLKGVEIGTHINGRNLDEFREFFSVIGSLGIPVFIHPQITDVIGKDRLRRYFFTNILGVPIEDTIAAAYLITSGIIQDYNIKVILPHGGGFLPYQIGRLDHGYKTRSDVREKISKKPSDFLSNFYFDTLLFNNEILDFMIRFVGVDNIVLGSDYPFKMGYFRPYDAIEHLSNEEKEKICEINAKKLLLF
ncbi:amidohydrolase family protein [Sulfolobus tengchongensis]|uniref:Amidohydrolase family protein n=1 Tax=Sulfolobus tengchongensis TaxID=207809 RepID=A0AAX4KXT5_9CREN